MRVIEAFERGLIELPIADVIATDGVFQFLEETRGRGYFDVDYKKGKLQLVAGNHIGQIPLTRDIAINVRPKVPLSNLARVIGIANQPIHCLATFKRKYSISADDSKSITEAIARSFLQTLRSVDAEGVYRQYTKLTRRLSSPRGRPLLRKQIANLARIQPTTVTCAYHVLSADTLFNQAVKKAIATIGDSLATGGAPTDLLRELGYFYDLFEGTSLNDSPHLVQQVRRELTRTTIPEIRRYYVDLLDASLLILEGHGIELASASGATALHSLIVNLEEAFENYILHVLRTSESLRVVDLATASGNSHGKRRLFRDTDIYVAKPDFVVSRGNRVAMIGDAKYKAKVAESDRYQLISHALSFGAQQAFFVTPRNGIEVSGSHKVGEIGDDPISIYHYSFDLNAPDLVSEEARLCDWIRSQCA